MFIFLFLRGAKFFLPFLALYFEQSLFTVTNVAIIMSLRSFSTMLFEIPSGAISDLFGRKNTLLLSTFTNLITICLLYIGDSMSVFLIYAVLAGLSTSLISGTDTAFIHDELEILGKTKRFKKVIGNYFTLWPFGAVFGSLVGGYLAKTSIEFAILISLVPVGISLILLSFLKEPKVEREKHHNVMAHSWDSLKYILRKKQLILLILAGAIGVSFGFSIYQLNALFLDYKEIPLELFGWVAAGIFLSAAFGSYISNYISNRIGNKAALVLSISLAAILYLSATFISSPFAVLPLIIGFGVFRIKKPIINHFINIEASTKNRATVVSISSFVDKLGLTLSMLVLGYVADLYDINAAYMLSASLLLLAPMLYMFIRDDEKVE